MRNLFILLLIGIVCEGSPVDAAVIFTLGANNSPEVVTSGGTGSRWVIGSGWGTDASETSSPTLLGATFDVRNTLPTESFSLSAGGSQTFNFGSITVTEPNAGGGIQASEIDNLALTAFLFFVAPPGVGEVANAGVPIALTGSVSDAAGDLSLTLASVLVNFGLGGQFTVDLQDVIFTTTGQALSLDATVTLLAEPEDVAVVPEPSSLVLAGTAILSMIGVGVRRRRCDVS